MKEAFDANRACFIHFGLEVLSVVYGAEEAAEETNALMNYFLFFPRSFFYIFPHSPTHSRQLSAPAGAFSARRRSGHICKPLIPSNKERKGPFSHDDTH